MTVGESSVLVLHPKKESPLHISAMRLEDLQKPTTYAERLFTDLWKIHQDDHCKGNTSSFVQEIVTVMLLKRFARCSRMSALIALGS